MSQRERERERERELFCEGLDGVIMLCYESVIRERKNDGHRIGI